jgi:hypothetical protein
MLKFDEIQDVATEANIPFYALSNHVSMEKVATGQLAKIRLANVSFTYNHLVLLHNGQGENISYVLAFITNVVVCDNNTTEYHLRPLVSNKGNIPVYTLNLAFDEDGAPRFGRKVALHSYGQSGPPGSTCFLDLETFKKVYAFIQSTITDL